MTNHESLNAPGEKIDYNPLDFGIDPEMDETQDAIVGMSEGDLILFALERQLSATERDHKEGLVPLDEYYRKNDLLFAAIDDRRKTLWLPERPRPY